MHTLPLELAVFCKPKQFQVFNQHKGMPFKLKHAQSKTLTQLTADSVILVEQQSWTSKLAKSLAHAYVIILGEGIDTKISAQYQHLSYTPQFISLREIIDASSCKRILAQAALQQRKLRRLVALQNHKNKGWDFEKDPALFLITELARTCSLSEKRIDVLQAVAPLKEVLDFQFCTLVITSDTAKPIESWKILPNEKYPSVFYPCGEVPQSVCHQDISIMNAAAPGSAALTPLNEPWSSALVVNLKPRLLNRKKNSPTQAYIVLFRNKLLPFTEKEAWLLEMSIGPLTLALEKAIMLENIQEASAEWRSTFDAITEPITVIDENYNISKANRSFANIVATDIKALKGRKCHTLLAKRRSPCPHCPISLSHQKQGLKIKDLNGRDLLVWSYTVKAKKENFHFQFYRNLEKETQLRSALVQSEKMAALGKLVGSIAHELNNPLAGILSTVQIALADKLTPALHDDFTEILLAARRSKSIIDNLLEFTSQSSSVMDIPALVNNTLQLCKSALRGITIEAELPPQKQQVFGNPGMLQQVLFNLIMNAIQAMSGAGKILISYTEDAELASLLIKDCGPGISAERLKSIFDPFYTSKSEGQGTGLGLSIVKNLVHRMNGAIKVSSNLGSGTEFLLSFPISR